MKKAIAITLYDKFDELGILVDIIRSHFSEKYIIAVCSNDLGAESKIGHLDIDGFAPGRDIFFDPKLPWTRGRPLIACRSTDSVQTSCRTAIELGADVVAHMHCDAWPLDEERFLAPFGLVSGGKCRFAARGYGFGAYGQDVPIGRIDDHFFFFDAHYLRDVGFFDFDPLDMLPHKLSVHGILALQILTRVGLKNFYLYDDQSGCECWPGRKKVLPWYPVKPSAYDPERRFLHVHRQSFPEELGQQLQALYLRKNGISEGKCVSEFLNKYRTEELELVERLDTLEQRLTRSLRRWGIRPEPLAQDLVAMQRALAEAKTRPWITQFAVNSLRNMRRKLRRWRSGKTVEYGYADSLWPMDIGGYYRQVVDKSHFPDGTEFWFNR